MPRDELGRALLSAAGNGDLMQLKALLADGANINFHLKDGTTAATEAIKNHHPNTLRYLLQKGHDLMVGDRSVEEGQSLLHVAVLEENLRCLDVILADANVNIDCFDCANRTPLFYAITKGNVTIVNKLLRKGCDVDVRMGVNRPIHEAVKQGNLEICRLLVAQDCDINAEDSNSMTPLEIALQYKLLGEPFSYDTNGRFEMLIQLGADLNMPLMKAIKNGCIDDTDTLKIQVLLHAGAEVNAMDNTSCGNTPLITSIFHGNHTATDILLVLDNINVHMSNLAGQSALHIAAAKDDMRSVELLLSSGADPTMQDKKGNTPLITSIINTNHRVTEVLLATWSKDIYKRNFEGLSPLHFAAQNNDAKLVKELLTRSVNPSLQDEMGRTALNIAAHQGHVAIVQLLANQRSGLNIVDKSKITPLLYSVARNCVRSVRFLLKAGADPNIPCTGTGNTPLIMATKGGLYDIVCSLLQSNCNVNAINYQEHSALHEAADRGDINVIQVLILAGAYVNMQTSEGDTALLIATRQGQVQAVEMLLEVNCDVNIRNSNRMSAIHEAALWGHPDILQLIIMGGADINSTEAERDSPLILSAMKGHAKIAKLLLMSGCNINHVNEVGRTALMEAADRGYLDLVNLLAFWHGALVDVKDSEGDTAVILAAAKNFSKIVQSLLTAKCDISTKNRWQRNALHEACSVWVGGGDTVESLLDAGMCPDTPDGMNNTPLIMAMLSGNAASVGHLIKANCNVNQSGMEIGKAIKPIQIAVAQEMLSIAQMLYLAGCDMNPVNSWMDTPEGPRYQIQVKFKEMETWLMAVTSTPPDMRQICRTVVRRSLGYENVEGKILELPLPAQVKQYLCLRDIDEFLLQLYATDNLLPCWDSWLLASRARRHRQYGHSEDNVSVTSSEP